MKKKIGLFFAITFLALLLLFVVQNLQSVELSFAIWDGEITLAVPILLAYVLGGLTFRPVWRFLNRQRVQHSQDKKVEKSQAKANVPVVAPTTQDSATPKA